MYILLTQPIGRTEPNSTTDHDRKHSVLTGFNSADIEYRQALSLNGNWEISDWNVSSGSGNSIDLSSFIETLNTDAEKLNFLGLLYLRPFYRMSSSGKTFLNWGMCFTTIIIYKNLYSLQFDFNRWLIPVRVGFHIGKLVVLKSLLPVCDRYRNSKSLRCKSLGWTVCTFLFSC